jgi:hypothetical protein
MVEDLVTGQVWLLLPHHLLSIYRTGNISLAALGIAARLVH